MEKLCAAIICFGYAMATVPQVAEAAGTRVNSPANIENVSGKAGASSRHRTSGAASERKPSLKKLGASKVQAATVSVAVRDVKAAAKPRAVTGALAAGSRLVWKGVKAVAYWSAGAVQALLGTFFGGLAGGLVSSVLLSPLITMGTGQSLPAAADTAALVGVVLGGVAGTVIGIRVMADAYRHDVREAKQAAKAKALSAAKAN